MKLLRATSRRPYTTRAMVLTACLGLLSTCRGSTMLDLSRTTVVVRAGTLPPAELTAARVLLDEVRKRTGLNWPISTVWPARGSVIAIASGAGDPGWRRAMPTRAGADLPEHRAEGFRLAVEHGEEKP